MKKNVLHVSKTVNWISTFNEIVGKSRIFNSAQLKNKNENKLMDDREFLMI